MNFILLLLIFLPSLNSQVDFDQYLSRYDSFVRIWVSGYENIGNRGSNRGCCFSRNGTVCNPCRYRVIFRVSQTEPFTFSSINFLYELGTFSRQAESLFETFYFEKLYSWFNINDHDVNFFNTERTSTRPIETMQKFIYFWYGNYEFDGSYGDMNRMKIWMVMSLSHYGFLSLRHANLIIQSIVFDRYRLSTGDCCAGDPEDIENTECSTPCSFYIIVNDGFSDILESRVIPALNNTKTYAYNLTLGFSTGSISQVNRRLRILLYTQGTTNLIDSIELRNLALLRRRTYFYYNVAGSDGNVRANISLNFYCNGNAGVLCSRSCQDIKGVDSCDNTAGLAMCLNGASDSRRCERFVTSCETNPCLNNGTCKILNNNRLICVCENGYSGKYCQDISCDKNCNSRGLCASPNKCICEFPFHGDNCEFQECNLTVKSICQNDGFCFYDGLIPKCNCVNPRFRGRFCEIIVCENECINGICISIPSSFINKCSCYQGFSGPSCDRLESNTVITKNPALLPLLIITAIVTLLFSILSIMKYKGIFFKKEASELVSADDISN